MEENNIRLNSARQRKTIFSGVQPSGDLHIGNYLGAISKWVEMQNEHNCIFCVVDYHAITVKQDPEILRKKIIEAVKIYLASGINPEKSVIFQQSAISAHTELAWILNTITRHGDLTKMTQFKDKTLVNFEEVFNNKKFNELISIFLKDSVIKALDKTKNVALNKLMEKKADQMIRRISGSYIKEFKSFKEKFNKVGVGLYDYPVLMAADILLYNTDAVPVGDDQSQHVELCRSLAKRFNSQFGDTFKIPELIIRKEGARIMGLDDSRKKMSKSADSPANYIALTDKPETAMKKIMKAVTDSGKEIVFDKNKKPAISNLLTIYSLLAGESIKELENKYKNKGYGDFKKDLAKVVAEFLIKFQKKFNSFTDEEVKEIMEAGARKIKPIAEETLGRVKERIGVL